MNIALSEAMDEESGNSNKIENDEGEAEDEEVNDAEVSDLLMFIPEDARDELVQDMEEMLQEG